MIIKKIFSVFLFSIIFAGCTSQSSQINLLKNTFTKDDNNELLPNWIITWQGHEEEVFAINTEKSLYFANRNDLLVEFYDNQIVSIRNFISIGSLIYIEQDTNNLFVFKQNSNRIATAICDQWTDESMTEGFLFRTQRCLFEGSESMNKIFYNNNQEIIELEYYIYPFATKLNIKLNKNINWL